MKSHTQPLNLEQLLASEARTNAQPLLACEPLNLSRLEVSSYGLAPGDSQTQSAGEDRIYILLQGAVQVSQQGDKQEAQQALTEPGAVVFQPGSAAGKIHCLGNVPAVVLAAQLKGKGSRRPQPWLKFASASPKEAIARHGCDADGKTLALDGPTSGLKRLHCFFLTLGAGDQVPVHQHRDHGVLMLGLSGEIDIDGSRLNSPSLMYYRGGEPHGFEVVGDAGFRGLAIEFYRDPPPSEQLRSLARQLRARLRAS